MHTRSILFVALCAAFRAAAADTDVKIVFFEHQDQSGGSSSYHMSVPSNDCTSCQGFGDDSNPSFQSYSLLEPCSSEGRHSMYIYNGNRCGESSERGSDHMTNGWDEFPDGLKRSVHSWIICAPGASV